MSRRKVAQACALCGHTLKGAELDRALYSTWTRNYYCPPLRFAKCDRAARRRRKESP